MVDLTAVESSVIAAAGYDEQRRVLYILFNNGRAYEYYDIPLDVYTRLMAAESKGRFLNEKVLDLYRYDRFRGWKRAVPSN
jgi:hypothetical protein